MRVYHGTLTEHGGAVVVEDDGEYRALDPRHDLQRLAPDGFAWGQSNSGAAQLALALAADVLGNDRKALQLYQRFMYKCVSRLPGEGWVRTEHQLREALDAIVHEYVRAR